MLEAANTQKRVKVMSSNSKGGLGPSRVSTSWEKLRNSDRGSAPAPERLSQNLHLNDLWMGGSEIVVVVQSLSQVQLFAAPRVAAHHSFLSLINSQSLPKFMSIK